MRTLIAEIIQSKIVRGLILYRGSNAGSWVWIGIKTRTKGDRARENLRMQDLLTILAFCWTRNRWVIVIIIRSSH